MSVNYEYFKVFCCVAEYQNITRAAEKLCLTQPSVTKSIHALEKQLDCLLFERTKRGVELTPAGNDLYQKIKPACLSLSSAEESLRQQKALHHGVVRICTGLPSLSSILLPVLHTFRMRYPGVSIEIQDNHSEIQLRGLESGEFDILFDLAPADSFVVPSNTASFHKKIHIEPLYTTRDIPVAGPTFASLTEDVISMDNLLDFPLIFRKIDTTSSDFYHTLLQEKIHHNQNSYLVADTLLARIRMTQANLGISFIPPECIQPEISNKSLLPLRIAEPLLERRFIMITRSDCQLTFAAKAFLECFTAR